MEEKHKGLRYNSGKLRYDLVHPHAQKGLVKVLTKGAEKYALRNWEQGMLWSNVIASLKRHLAAFEAGEDYDPETGELHMDHVQCNAHFLSAYYKIYPQGDDRPHNYLRKVKIGLDIDEVLCNWVSSWVDIHDMKIPNSWSFDREMLKRFNDMRDAGKLDEFYLTLLPLMDPKDLPFEPHCYVTARPVKSEVTEEWLDQCGFPARPVYTVEPGLSKVDICLREGIDIFVDDSYDNFIALNNAGICCFLYDAPHNARYDVGFKRLYSLKQLL